MADWICARPAGVELQGRVIFSRMKRRLELVFNTLSRAVNAVDVLVTMTAGSHVAKVPVT
jgi:hypothetical protein